VVAISFAVQLVSAKRRAAASRSPCATHEFATGVCFDVRFGSSGYQQRWQKRRQ
jgi:hypothetical protein